MAANKVPAIYLKSYPSLKPLGSWTRDLLARLDQLNKWIKETYPSVYWLAGRGLHSSTFQLNLSAFHGIGGALRGY